MPMLTADELLRIRALLGEEHYYFIDPDLLEPAFTHVDQLICEYPDDGPGPACTLAMLACYQNNLALVLLCLELGANINTTDQYGQTRLVHYALYMDDNNCLTVLQALQQRDQDFSLTDEEGLMPAMLAAKSGKLLSQNWLLELPLDTAPEAEYTALAAPAA